MAWLIPQKHVGEASAVVSASGILNRIGAYPMQRVVVYLLWYKYIL